MLDDDAKRLAVWHLVARAPLKLLVSELLAQRGISSLTMSQRGLVKERNEGQIKGKNTDAYESLTDGSLVLGLPNITIMATKSTRDAKLAKDDASGIPTHLWDVHVWDKLPKAKANAVLEKIVNRWFWSKCLYSSYMGKAKTLETLQYLS